MRSFKLLAIFLVITLFIGGCTSKEVINFNPEDLSMQLETDHFQFYCIEKDKKCLKDLSELLEGSLERVTTDLGVELDYKPKILIYPDITSFQNAIAQLNAPSIAVGTMWDKDIKMVSPLYPIKGYSRDDIKKVILHEFVHILHSNITKVTKESQYWLWEGVAYYEAGQLDLRYKLLIKKQKLLSIPELRIDFYNIAYGYTYAASAVDFIVNQYGYDKLQELILYPDDFEKVLNISLEEFQKQWLEYIKFHYV